MLVNKGFSLIELMVVIAIVAILASIGLPSFQEIISASRVKSAASDLQMSLLRARSEAGKRNADITVAPSGGTWSDGWTTSGGVETHGSVQATISGAPASVIYKPNGRNSGGAVGFSISSPDTATVRCVAIELSGQPVIRQQACS